MSRDPLRIHGAQDQPDALRGIIEARPVAPGSKQAHDAPVLVTSDGRWARLHLVGDNPFDHAGLRALIGRQVTVSGTWQGMTLAVLPEGVTLHDATAGEED